MRKERRKKDPLDRFWSKVDVRGNEECWPWKHGLTSAGYALARFNGRKEIYAHRFSWEFHNAQEIPPGLHVCHSCDNPKCVNPVHLFLGTAKDNMRDMISKGRAPIGEARPNAKANQEMVKMIRSSDESTHVLVGKTGLSRSLVQYIRNGKRWRHVA